MSREIAGDISSTLAACRLTSGRSRCSSCGTSPPRTAACLAADSGHGGDEYEQVTRDGEILLQLHHLEVEHHHGRLADHDLPLGNGVLVWFEVADFDAAVAQVRAIGAPVVRDVHVNPNAQQQELWLRDPDGYLVVLAGPSEYRPRVTTAAPPSRLPRGRHLEERADERARLEAAHRRRRQRVGLRRGDCTVRSFDDADGPALERTSTPRLMSKR